MRLRKCSRVRFNLGHHLNASKSIASPPWVIVLGLFVSLGFLGTSFVFGIVVLVLCPWICCTVANLVSFSIAQFARLPALVYLSLEAPRGFCNWMFIPLCRHLPTVELSNPVSLATSLNSFLDSVIDFCSCLIFFSVILASRLTSMTPNWLLCSWANPAQFPHVFSISSSVYGVIYLPASSFNRVMAYRIVRLLYCFAHLSVLK